MFRKTFNVALSAMLLLTALGVRPIRAQAATDAKTAETRAKVHQLGVGQDARVEIKLWDDRKLKGYVSASAEDSFTVVDSKTGTSRAVAYADVAQLKKPSGGASSARTWGIIGAVAIAALVIGVTVVKPAVCDGGAGC